MLTKNWYAKAEHPLKKAVRSSQHEMEKLLYLQTNRSLGANFDELNIELENLYI